MSEKKAKADKKERTPKLINITAAATLRTKPRSETSKRGITYAALFQKQGSNKGVTVNSLATALSATGSMVTDAIARSWVEDVCKATGAGAESKLDSKGQLRVWGIMPKKAA